MLVLPHNRDLLNSAPAWVLAGAGLDLDFQNGRYFQRGVGNSKDLVTTSRASSGTNLLPTSPSGFAYSTFASNLPRITPGLGLLVEEARTNSLLNSTAPATQATASLGTGTYTLWVNGSGSATSSAGTATGSGFGAATQGSPNVITITGAGTVVVTVAGSLNAFQLEAGTWGTSLIVTADTTATRAFDNISLANVPLIGSSLTEFGKATPHSPVTNGVSQFFSRIDDGSVNNRVDITRILTTALSRLTNTSGGAAVTASGAAWAQNTSGRIVITTATSDQALSFNGGTIGAASGAFPIGPLTTFHIGSQGSTVWNGYLERIALWPNARLPNADLQRITA